MAKSTTPKKTAVAKESKPVELTAAVAATAEVAAGETAKPAKAAAKPETPPPAAAAEAPAKKPRAKAPAKTEAPAAASGETATAASAESASAEPDPATLYRMIQEAAYYLAEKRNFAPGFDQEDWETATAQVMASLGKGNA